MEPWDWSLWLVCRKAGDVYRSIVVVGYVGILRIWHRHFSSDTLRRLELDPRCGPGPYPLTFPPGGRGGGAGSKVKLHIRSIRHIYVSYSC